MRKNLVRLFAFISLSLVCAFAWAQTFSTDQGTTQPVYHLSGSSGPQWVNDAGAIEARNGDASALATVRAASPVGTSDLASKSYSDTHLGGTTLPTPASGYPHFASGSFTWDAPVASGVAGGVLTGTYPNPGMAASGVTAGTYGSSIASPIVTVGADGRLTTVTTTPIASVAPRTSWTTPAWYVDPANGTGCANDTNTGTSATCGGGNVGPLATLDQVYVRWGTTTPTTTSAVVINLLSNDTSADPWYAVPVYNGGQLTVQGVPTQVGTATISTFTPRVTATTPALDKIVVTGLTGGSWTPFVGNLVHDTTANAWFRVNADLGSATAKITAPVNTAFIPAWVTIANGDALVIYSLPTITVLVADSSLTASLMQFSELNLNAAFTDIGNATFDRCSFTSGEFLIASSGTKLTDIYNCDVDTSAAIQGFVSILAGQDRSGSTTLLGTATGSGTAFTSILDGDVIMTGNIYVSNSLNVGAAGFFDADYADLTRQPNYVTLGPLYYGTARQWGTANFNIANGTKIGLNQSGVSSMLLTGTYTLDGSTTACNLDTSFVPAVANCNITVSPANFDLAISSGGFGGVMFDQYDSKVFRRNATPATPGTNPLPVAHGGTGDTTLTSHGLLLGEGTSAVSSLLLSDGNLVFGQSAADPAGFPFSQDVTTTDHGVATVQGLKTVALPSLAAGYLHGTGTSFTWDAVPLGVSTLIFQPGGTAGGNVFTSWSSLVIVANTLQGDVRILLDGSHNSNAVTLPSGTWAFTAPAVTLSAGPSTTAGPIFTNTTTVTAVNGCTLSGVTNLDSMIFDYTGTGSVFSYSSGRSQLTLTGAWLQSLSTGPTVLVSGSAFLQIAMANASQLGDGTHATLNSTSSSPSNVEVYGASLINANSISGGTSWGVVLEGASATSSAIGPNTGLASNPPYLIYHPNSTFTEPNLFTDWGSLVEAATSLSGPLTIYFDCSDVSNTCTIPAGTWLFNNQSVKFDGQVPSAGTVTKVTVNIANGATLSGVTEISNILMFSKSSSAVFNITTNAPTLRLTGYANLDNDNGTSPMISVNSGGDLILDLFNNSGVGEINANPVLTVDGASAFSVRVYDSSGASTTSFAGTLANYELLIGGSAVQGAGTAYPAGVFAFYASQAKNVGYNDGLFTPTTGQTQSQGMFDYLKQHSPIFTSLSTGYVNWTGSAWALTSVIPNANQGCQNLSGDVGGTTCASVVDQISGPNPVQITTANTLEFAQGIASATYTQAQAASANPGHPIFFEGQQGGAGNEPGGAAVLIGGQPTGSGAAGEAAVSSSDSTGEILVPAGEVRQLAGNNSIDLKSDNTNTITLGSISAISDIGYTGVGTVNTQALLSKKFRIVCTTSTTGLSGCAGFFDTFPTNIISTYEVHWNARDVTTHNAANASTGECTFAIMNGDVGPSAGNCTSVWQILGTGNTTSGNFTYTVSGSTVRINVGNFPNTDTVDWTLDVDIHRD